MLPAKYTLILMMENERSVGLSGVCVSVSTNKSKSRSSNRLYKVVY